MIKSFSHEQALRRMGAWHLIRLIAIAQSIALLGAIPGILAVSVNAEFDAEHVRAFSILVPVLIIATFLILLGIAWRITPIVRKKLDMWADETIRAKPDDDLLAWREITSLSWRYGVAAALTILIIDILPLVYVSLSQGQVISSAFQPTGLNLPNPIYVLIGGLVSLCGSVIIAMLLIERFTMPLRLILLPKDVETQLKGHAGLLLKGKILGLTLAVIGITVLLIAPIGYHHTLEVLYGELSSMEIFRGMRLQSILFSSMALILGAGLSYYVTRGVSDPIYELIKTFNKIEQGDLTQRAPITATDELGIVTVQFNRMVSRLENRRPP
jgi:HAMP domain-containing protein